MTRSGIPFIYNPMAGGGSERKIRQAVHELENLGGVLEPLPTPGPGSARAIARDAAAAGAGRIIIAGGDGTINEVINGIGESDIELAIIPVGTANVLAKALSVPMQIRDACRLAMRGEIIRLDLGLAGDRYFALMAGIGFDALTIKNLDPLLKKTLRHAAYPISGIKTLITEELPLISVTAGEHMTEGYFVVAANSRYYGGRFGPTPLAHMQDGLLDFCVLKEKNIPDMLRFWVSSLRREQLEEPTAEYFRAGSAHISCPAGSQVLVQTDGEVVGELPMDVSVIPGALRIRAGIGA